MAAILHKQLCPKNRLQTLINLCGTVEINDEVSAKLYYQTGLNMYKQFYVYYNHGAWENALCIYWKYEKMFFKKIKKHPGYAGVSVNVKSVNASNFRTMKPKGLHAEKELFKQYQRIYHHYIEELKGNKLMYGRDLCASVQSTGEEQHKRLSAFSAASYAAGQPQCYQQADAPPRYETTLSVKSASKDEKRASDGDNSLKIHSEMSFQTAWKLAEAKRKSIDCKSNLMEFEKVSMRSRSTSQKSEKSDQKSQKRV